MGAGMPGFSPDPAGHARYPRRDVSACGAEGPQETGARVRADGGRVQQAIRKRLRRLKQAREAYREWLSFFDKVSIAAQSLRAYNEVLSHELAHLYRDWFRRAPLSMEPGSSPALPFAEVVAYRKWPEILTENSVHAIARASSGSELLQALGKGTPPRTASDGDGQR